ncbi:MAG: NADH-quinone oxidoreductase subunit D [Methanobacteriota archaeon]
MPQKTITLNMGPQHPSTHGVLRLIVELDGEVVRGIEPVIGYLHRGVEKLAEEETYLQVIPHSDRLDYVAAMHNNMAVCHAVERLMGVEIPKRADYTRVLAMEIQRLASHYLALGTFGLDLGALTPFFWCFRDREYCLELLEDLSGARLTYSYFRFGGVRFPPPPNFKEKVRRYIGHWKEGIAQVEEVLTDNDIFRVRTEGVGYLDPKIAVNYGCTGPMLRGSGVDFDLRRAEPYSVYPELDFAVCTGTGKGDTFSRYRCRLDEMQQSLRIIEQAIEKLPDSGDYINPKIGEGAKQNRVKPPAGEVYARIESPRGEIGVFLVSKGGDQPYRLHFRSHSLSNLQVIKHLAPGQKIPDLIATLGSIDIVLGDIDR